MKIFLCALALALAFVGGAVAQESVTLSTPITSTIATKHVGYIAFDLDNSRIIAQVENASNTVIITKVYDSTTNPTGATLLHNINIGNFSVNSLMKAVYNRLLADGVIETGSISGTAQ